MNGDLLPQRCAVTGVAQPCPEKSAMLRKC